MTSGNDIHVGFMPLMDAAILIVAREMGFAESEGIGLHLHRETSWANIRDRMAVGQFDAAHVGTDASCQCAQADTDADRSGCSDGTWTWR